MRYKHKLPVISFLTSIILIFVIIGLIGSLWRILGRRSLLKARQTELQRLQIQTKDLQVKLTQVQTPEFVEREAREKLNLGKAGETIVLINKTVQTTKNQEQRANELPNWKKWWNLFF